MAVTSRVVVIVLGGVVVVGAAAAVIVMNKPAEKPPVAAVSPHEPAAPVTAAPTPAPASRRAATPAATTPATTPAATPEAAPKLGTLVIESDVPETSVFIDRVFLGMAPVTAKDIAPGQHRLNMSVTGYEGVSETIDVEPGTRTISMKFKEIKLDEKIDVTHKHAMGSCSGTLRASPQRLAYETTNAGDAFVSALTNLDTFQMDFVQKNLRVKVRDGKTYHFPVSGDGTALYQFHQTVEKVRQRLLSGRRP